MPVINNDEHGDGDDNDDGFDNEDGECSLSTSCMMERGASLIITPRDYPLHVSHHGTPLDGLCTANKTCLRASQR